MKTKLIILLVVLGLQTAWILGTTVTQERALAGGRTVLLETVPVDPRDLLRGDYVILSYKISRVPLSQFAPALSAPPATGKPVYVLLEQRDRFHEVVQASTEPLTPAHEGQRVLRGTATPAWGARTTNEVGVNYGLERYYVREGTGNPRGKLTVEVAVPATGNGRIKQVFVDGKPYAEAMKEQLKDVVRP